MSCTCSLPTAPISVKLEISTTEDGSHGDDDDDDDDDNDDFIVESIMLNFVMMLSTEGPKHQD